MEEGQHLIEGWFYRGLLLTTKLDGGTGLGEPLVEIALIRAVCIALGVVQTAERQGLGVGHVVPAVR